MKIIAKECPKCGANLNFKVGDKEARCDSCRHEFVIEYDHSKTNLEAADFKLSPNMKMMSLMIKIVAIMIFIMSAAMMVFSFIARQRMIEGMNNIDIDSTPVIIDDRGN